MTRTPKVPELDTPRTVERTVKQPRLSYIDKQTHPTGGIIHVLKTAGYGLIERMSAGGLGERGGSEMGCNARRACLFY